MPFDTTRFDTSDLTFATITISRPYIYPPLIYFPPLQPLMFARACFGCFTAAPKQAPISIKSLEGPQLSLNRPFNAMITDGDIFIELPMPAALHKVSDSGPQQLLDSGLKKADQVPASPTACQQDDAMPDTDAATGELASEPAVSMNEAVISPAPTVAIIRGGQKAEAADGVNMPAAPAAKPVVTAGDKTAPATLLEAAAPPLALLGGGFIGGTGGSRGSGGGGGMMTRLGRTCSLPSSQSARITSGPANPYLLDALNRRRTPRSGRKSGGSGEPIADLAGMVQAFTRGRSLSVAVAETRAASECLSRGILPPPRGALHSSGSRKISSGSKCVSDLPSLRAHSQVEGSVACGRVPWMTAFDPKNFLVPLGYDSVGGQAPLARRPPAAAAGAETPGGSVLAGQGHSTGRAKSAVGGAAGKVA